VGTMRTFGTLDLLGLVEDYRQGLLTLLEHHLNRHPVPDRAE